jgi:aspartyl-tRNA(Asn)/glutamyl-tRNA(Gln) amidotransferase subunit C
MVAMAMGLRIAFRHFPLFLGAGISEHRGAMPEPSIDVRYVANLARLELDEEEISTFQGQLGSILGYIEKLGELDLEGIEPTAHPSPVFDRLEADEPRPGLDASALLDNAPDQASGQVRVPKVVADA